ncbi:MAG: aminotransferase class I/II-fold pyridoxal phosphate-dependent enzyme [Paracoccaceae bacterium]
MSGYDFTERRGNHSSSRDKLAQYTGVDPEDGLVMWTAVSRYRTAPCVIEAVRRAADSGLFDYSYYTDDYKNAVGWWMANRHGWTIEPDWIVTTQGLGHAIAMCLDVYTDPGDRVVIFPPVYHEFPLKIARAGRQVVECPLVLTGERYEIDFDAAQSRLDGSETMLIWCSPQNPSGRVWTPAELRAVAEFAERNDLILISDEVHHDLVYPGNRFVPMDVVVPELRHRIITATAASKTFNIAGMKTGNLIIPDAGLRDAMLKRLAEIDYMANRLGLEMVTAAYSPEGAAWADAQIAHLDANRAVFDAGLNAIPGVRSLPLQATYLAWVDFRGTGMSHAEISARLRDDARIGVSPGPGFGSGGDGFQRINFATSRAEVAEAVRRLQAAFSDLQ